MSEKIIFSNSSLRTIKEIIKYIQSNDEVDINNLKLYFNLYMNTYRDLYRYIISKQNEKYNIIYDGFYVSEDMVSDKTKKYMFMRYDYIYPIKNIIQIDDNVDYNACKIDGINGIEYIASECPFEIGAGEDYDICFFIKMLIDNDIKLVSIPSSIKDSNMFQWFPINTLKLNFKVDNKIIGKYKYDLDYELKCLSIYNHIDEKNITKEKITSYVIEIKDKKTEKIHNVKILQYDNWPDLSVPKNTKLFMKYIYRIFRYVNGLDKMLTHCSAGVGRTGTVYCCVEILNYINSTYYDFKNKKLLNEDFNKSNINNILKDLYIYVFKFIYKLRLNRFYMVQTTPQFELILKFINDIVNSCLSSFDFNSLQQNKQQQFIQIPSPLKTL